MLSRAAWARVLPFLVYVFFLAAVDLLGRFGFSAQDLRWVYALKAGAVLLTLAVNWRHYTELHTLDLTIRKTALAVVTGLLVFWLWIHLNAGWMQIGTSDGFDPTSGGHIDWALVAVRIAGAALVVPVMEELFWRSFLARWIVDPDFERVDPSRMTLKSAAITVVLFGLEHNLWFAGMVAGLAYWLVYWRLRSLWAAIMAHAVTNGVLGYWVVTSASWVYW